MTIYTNKNSVIKVLSVLGLILFWIPEVKAQENPPIPIEASLNVEFSKSLNFGTFVLSSGTGNIALSHDNIAVPSAGITLLSFGKSPSPALFDVFAIPGTILRIQDPGEIQLTGTNGGNLRLYLDSFSTGRTFITTAPQHIANPVYVGGTLYVDSTNAPAGHYSGMFRLTFIHE